MEMREGSRRMGEGEEREKEEEVSWSKDFAMRQLGWSLCDFGRKLVKHSRSLKDLFFCLCTHNIWHIKDAQLCVSVIIITDTCW